MFGAESSFMSLLPLILIFVVFYFLLIRPQQKQMKERKNMLESLSKGDHIITNGGIMGKIVKIEEHDILLVEIAKNVEIKVIRSMVNSTAAKTPMAKKEEVKEETKKEVKKAPAPAAEKSKKAAPAKKPAAKKAPAKKPAAKKPAKK